MILDDVDAERGGPYRLRVWGHLVVLPAAADLDWRVVAGALSSAPLFAALVWPDGAANDVPTWKLQIAREAWRRHNGLPEHDQAQRLVYMMDRYYTGIEYDLRAKLGVSAGDLWRGRRWRELLGYIDQLPSDSHMNRMLSGDREHMEAVMRHSKDGGSGRPSMSDWSLTNSLLAKVVDGLNRVAAIQSAMANPKNRPQVHPEPRPATVAEKIREELRREQHEEMKAILLRDR